jgi:rubrerythrin
MMKIQEVNGKLSVVDFDEFQAYRIACQIEEDGIKFYKKLADAVSDPEVRQQIEFLKDQEQEHRVVFENGLLNLRAKKEDSSEDDDLLPSIDFEVFRPYDRIEGVEEALIDVTRALNLGVIVEDKSIQFYQHCQSQVQDVTVKAELDKIIEQEQSHKALLQSLLSKLG